jgi:alcohol dehydrogenase class IV
MDEIRYKFFTPTRLIFGVGCSAEIRSWIEDLDCRRVLLVTDRGLEKAGLLRRVLECIDGGDIEATVYSDVSENPTIGNVHAGRDLIRDHEIDCLVALGGGSPMDAAKAMAILSAHGGGIDEYELGLGSFDRAGPPVIAIPTTAGTGSEATMGAVITDPETHRKFDVVSPLMAPTVSLVDPDLTRSLPPRITAATGMDALTHAIEGYTATLASPLTDALHEKAIRLLGEHLIPAYKKGRDIVARTNVMMASMITGVGFPNSGLGSVHGLSMPLGGHFGIPHGIANAIMLPHVMRFNLTARISKFENVARFLGRDGDRPEEAVEAVCDIRNRLELPRLGSFNIEEERIPVLARDALGRNTNCATNPREMTESDAAEVYRTALLES